MHAAAEATIRRQDNDSICVELPGIPGVVMTAEGAESMASLFST